VRFRQDFFEEAPSAVGNRKTKVKINWGSPFRLLALCRPLSLGKPEPVTKIKGDNIDVDNATMRLRSGLSCGPVFLRFHRFPAPPAGFPPFPTFLFGRPLGRNRVRLAVETKTQKLRPAQVLHLTGKNRAENPKEKQ